MIKAMRDLVVAVMQRVEVCFIPEVQDWRRLSSADIDIMQANEPQKNKFREMLANAMASGLILACVGKLTPDEIKLALIDPNDAKHSVQVDSDGRKCTVYDVDDNSVIDAQTMKNLSIILDLRSGFVKSGSDVTLAMTVEMALRFVVESLRGSMVCDGNKVRYTRFKDLLVWDGRAFSEFWKPDLLRDGGPEGHYYEFSIPSELGALLALINHDMATLPPGLRLTWGCRVRAGLRYNPTGDPHRPFMPDLWIEGACDQAIPALDDGWATGWRIRYACLENVVDRRLT